MIAKADIRRVQEWMRHADIQTTMKYLHYAPRARTLAWWPKPSSCKRRVRLSPRPASDLSAHQWLSGHLKIAGDQIAGARPIQQPSPCRSGWSSSRMDAGVPRQRQDSACTSRTRIGRSRALASSRSGAELSRRSEQGTLGEFEEKRGDVVCGESLPGEELIERFEAAQQPQRVDRFLDRAAGS